MNRLLLIALVLLAGCKGHNPSGNLVYFTDVDNLAGWYETPTIIKFKAHSGEFVCKIDTINSFGLTFKKRMSEISGKAIFKVDVSAWVYVNDLGAKGGFVCSLDSMLGKGFVYLNERFDEKIDKAKRWTKVKSEFFFPDSYDPDFIFAVYLWNTGKEDIFADDLEIRITEY